MKKVIFAMLALISAAAAQAQSVTPAEARAIAKDAVIYGFPLVDNYRIQYSYFVDRSGPEFKASWNEIVNNARVYTPDDRAIQTPNSDTPYSYVGADLRAEPIVLTVPAVGEGRYYSLQFIDQYTFNFAYVGSRATGNGAGRYLLAGPRWNGATPEGITSVIRSETDFAFVLYRTQLFDPGDIDSVKAIQAGYKVQPISQFLGQPAPAAAPRIDFMKPLTPEQERTSLQFFSVLNFILQFCPTHPSETALIYRLNVRNVPVDGFWSVSVYDAQGYYQKNPFDAYALNNITARKEADGAVAIQFGGCDGGISNCLPIMKGWNYTVRLYCPRAEILNGTWKFPEPQPAGEGAL